ncbi:hypothetical protein Trydic_g16821 [Trypoxylus dichotomus]
MHFIGTYFIAYGLLEDQRRSQIQLGPYAKKPNFNHTNNNSLSKEEPEDHSSSDPDYESSSKSDSLDENTTTTVDGDEFLADFPIAKDLLRNNLLNFPRCEYYYDHFL